MIYDQKPVDDYRPLKKRQPVPAPPLNVAVRARCVAPRRGRRRPTTQLRLQRALWNHGCPLELQLCSGNPCKAVACAAPAATHPPPPPPPPLRSRLQAAQAKLQESKDAKKKEAEEAGKEEEEDDL